MEAQLAANAYAAVAKSTAPPKALEYQVFARATRDLTAAASAPKEDFPKTVQALHNNLRLWTLLAADVAMESNGLPADLRSKIVYLAQYTRAHTAKTMRGEASIKPLIEINTAVMRGLRARPGANDDARANEAAAPVAADAS
ncbi:MAG: flagellar biosynthesis regulator FlaF [Pseudomonadota bacterium]